MSITPIIINNGSNVQLVYSFELAEHEDGDTEDLIEDLAAFIKEGYHQYYTRYTNNPEISKSVRVVDYDFLAERIVSEKERLKENGDHARFYLIFYIQQLNKNNQIPVETINYHIHWYGGEKDFIVPVYPIGFNTLQSARSISATFEFNTLFDLRVLQREVENSLSYYTENVIPHLDPYFTYIKEMFTRVSKNDFTVDLDDVRIALKDAIVSHYEKRLADPASNDREIIYLDVAFVGKNPETALVTFRVRARTETTDTPELPVYHSDYKSSVVQESITLFEQGTLQTFPINLEVSVRPVS